MKILRPFIEEMKMLYIKMEYDWYKVANGELTESEINTLLFSYKKEVTNIEGKYLNEEILLENKDYLKEADDRTDRYFETNF